MESSLENKDTDQICDQNSNIFENIDQNQKNQEKEDLIQQNNHDQNESDPQSEEQIQKIDIDNNNNEQEKTIISEITQQEKEKNDQQNIIQEKEQDKEKQINEEKQLNPEIEDNQIQIQENQEKESSEQKQLQPEIEDNQFDVQENQQQDNSEQQNQEEQEDIISQQEEYRKLMGQTFLIYDKNNTPQITPQKDLQNLKQNQTKQAETENTQENLKNDQNEVIIQEENEEIENGNEKENENEKQQEQNQQQGEEQKEQNTEAIYENNNIYKQNIENSEEEEQNNNNKFGSQFLFKKEDQSLESKSVQKQEEQEQEKGQEQEQEEEKQDDQLQALKRYENVIDELLNKRQARFQLRKMQELQEKMQNIKNIFIDLITKTEFNDLPQNEQQQQQEQNQQEIEIQEQRIHLLIEGNEGFESILKQNLEQLEIAKEETDFQHIYEILFDSQEFFIQQIEILLNKKEYLEIKELKDHISDLQICIDNQKSQRILLTQIPQITDEKEKMNGNKLSEQQEEEIKVKEELANVLNQINEAKPALIQLQNQNQHQNQEQQQQLQDLEQNEANFSQIVEKVTYSQKQLVSLVDQLHILEIQKLKQTKQQINELKIQNDYQQIYDFLKEQSKDQNEGEQTINDNNQNAPIQENQENLPENQEDNNGNHQQQQQEQQQQQQQQQQQENGNVVQKGGKVLQFFKNPDNILKCVVLSIMMLWFSSISQFQAQIEEQNYRLKDIFNLLESSKTTRQLVYTSVLTFISCFWFFVRGIWYHYLGEHLDGQDKKIRGYLINYNPILQLFMIYITDGDIIQNKFEGGIWFSIFFVNILYRVYLSETQDMLKKILAGIYQDYSNELQITKKMMQFVGMIFFQNLAFTLVGIWLFWGQGIYILALMFYFGFLVFLESLKCLLMLQRLRANFQFYVDNNSDQINEPFYEVQMVFECVTQIVIFLHQFQLFYNYSNQKHYSFFNHIWFVLPVRSVQSCISILKSHIVSYKRYRKIKENIDRICPRVFHDELEQDDKCSICHDELHIARKLLKCGHKFHIKCLFNWLKHQKNSKCPMCRQDVDFLLADPNNLPNRNQRTGILSMIGRVFGFLSNMSFGGMSIHFVTVNQNENPQQNPNNLNDNQNNNNNNNQNQGNNQNQNQGNGNGFNLLQRLGNINEGLQQQLQAEMQQINQINQQLGQLERNAEDNNNNEEEQEEEQNNNNDNQPENDIVQGMYL